MANTSAQNPLLLSDVLAAGIDSVPSNYIRPISDRPDFGNVRSASDSSIPLIDLRDLDGPGRAGVIKEIGYACQNFGFFQVKNHGIPEEVIKAMKRVAKEFFELPESERLKAYSDDPLKTTKLATSFNVRTEKVSNWRDFLRIHCYPVEEFMPEWPCNPPSFRNDVAKYAKNVRGLALQLLETISESLSLDKGYINRALGKHSQHMALNYYPPCPQPELTYGLPAHADPNTITLLLQDEVPGLQVLKDSNWVAVNPIPNTFIVNVGDQIQVLSNDRYKSALHRAVVNCSKVRISIPTFYGPSLDAVIAPADILTNEDHPPLYRSFNYSEYYQQFWKRGLAKETCLDMFKAAPPTT